MKRLTTSVATFATSILMWSALPASAAWSDDPTVNLALSQAEGSQTTSPSSAVSAGAGGLIVAWNDSRNNTTTGTAIYAHHAFDAGLTLGDDFEDGDTGEWDAVFPSFRAEESRRKPAFHCKFGTRWVFGSGFCCPERPSPCENPMDRLEETVELLDQISECLQHGDNLKVADLTQQAIDAHIPAIEILDRGLLAGMDVVGTRFGAHEIFLPEVLLAARAMKAGMDLVKPLLVTGDAPSRGKIVLGTVKGDVHDIGKNLVGIMLAGAGFEVVDLGTGVAPKTFVDTALAEGATIIGLSALLTTTMQGMREVIDLIREGGHEDALKVIVGGAPLTQDFADSIGAAGYSYDAAGAVRLVKELTGAS